MNSNEDFAAGIVYTFESTTEDQALEAWAAALTDEVLAIHVRGIARHAGTRKPYLPTRQRTALLAEVAARLDRQRKVNE